MGAIFGFNWFDLLQMILINYSNWLQCRAIITEPINQSEVSGYPTGFT
ncbi:hypothetical protein CLHUN_01550 [Ruminiclostridium hungatei]|uniref:Uncharacterized protein n=1 Tax=Ruminiclostridium hungatei TaxID=48256 RepID=A0A1V4SR17_RUMHU|nr:hypothetical protein [Ruminiclostridium hungatei]OPX46339.1 hypothetical protein CLHUN_01550 [Ruminiclostridium hungatei]